MRKSLFATYHECTSTDVVAMGKEWVAFIPISHASPLLLIWILEDKPQRHVAHKLWNKKDGSPLMSLVASFWQYMIPFLSHVTGLLPLFSCWGVAFVSPMFCYSHQQQQGQQMSMAIGFFPLAGPPLTQQWSWLSMWHTHTHTQKGLYCVAGAAASPTICPISSGMLLSSLAIDRNEERIDRSIR